MPVCCSDACRHWSAERNYSHTHMLCWWKAFVYRGSMGALICAFVLSSMFVYVRVCMFTCECLSVHAWLNMCESVCLCVCDSIMALLLLSCMPLTLHIDDGSRAPATTMSPKQGRPRRISCAAHVPHALRSSTRLGRALEARIRRRASTGFA